MPTRSVLSTSAITADHPKGQKSVEVYRAQYNKAGLDEEAAQRLNENPGFAVYLAEGFRRFSSKQPDYSLARTILGKDFISPEEIATARGLIYTDEQLATFGDTLPAQDILEWCRDNGMMLVAGPPKALSLLDIRAIKTDYFYSNKGGWYADKAQKFARDDKAEPVWIALRKEPVADSFSKNWSEQSEFVTVPMVVPNAAEAAWGLTTYKAVRGIYLLPNVYVRTSSIDSGGHHVYVGLFDAKGLVVYSRWDGYRYVYLGVASARKF